MKVQSGSSSPTARASCRVSRAATAAAGLGHHAAQEGEGAPVAHSLLALVEGLSGAHDFRAEVVGLDEQVLVAAGEAVGLVGRFTDRETVLPLPIGLDVAAGALHEALGELDALGLGQRGGGPLAEAGAQQGQEGAEGGLDAAVRGGREEDEVAVLLGGDRADQLVALVLALVAVGGDGGAVSFVDDDEVRAVEQEGVLVPVALEESMLATWTG